MLAWEGRNDKKVAPEAEIRHIKEGRRGLRKGGKRKRGRERKERLTRNETRKGEGKEEGRKEYKDPSAIP